MKKLFAVLLAAVMLLCSVSALAEAKTVSLRVYVDAEQLKNVAAMTGAGENQDTRFEAGAKLLNALGIDLIADTTGGQLTILANDQEVASAGLAAAGDKVAIGATVLPNYVFTLDQETFQKLMKQFVPQVGELQSLDLNALGQTLMTYVAPFAAALQSAIVPGEPEQANVEVGEYTFDTKVPVNVDMKAIAEAAKKLASDLLNDATVQQVLQIAAQGKGIDVESTIAQVNEALAEDKLPTVTLDMYTISSRPEVRFMEGFVTGAGQDEPGLEVSVLIPGNGDVTVTCTMLQVDSQVITFHLDHEAQTVTLQATINGIFAAVVVGPAQSEEGQAFAANVYYINQDAPLAQIALTIKDGGELTVDLSTENKTEISVADLMGGTVDQEVMQALQQEAQTAVFGVLGKLMAAIPELGTLLQPAAQ